MRKSQMCPECATKTKGAYCRECGARVTAGKKGEK